MQFTFGGQDSIVHAHFNSDKTEGDFKKKKKKSIQTGRNCVPLRLSRSHCITLRPLQSPAHSVEECGLHLKDTPGPSVKTCQRFTSRALKPPGMLSLPNGFISASLSSTEQHLEVRWSNVWAINSERGTAPRCRCRVTSPAAGLTASSLHGVIGAAGWARIAEHLYAFVPNGMWNFSTLKISR